MTANIRYVLTAIDDIMLHAWNKHCGNLPNVSIVKASIDTVNCQALVAPTNSWCVMDGGADVAIARACGGAAFLDRVRKETSTPMPVGCAQAIQACTNSRGVQYAILAPTMVVPEKLPHDTVNPYLATIAAIKQSDRLKLHSVAFVGMGTGVGKIPHELAAWQWRNAWIDHHDGQTRPMSAFDTLIWRQRLITIRQTHERQLLDLLCEQGRHHV